MFHSLARFNDGIVFAHYEDQDPLYPDFLPELRLPLLDHIIILDVKPVRVNLRPLPPHPLPIFLRSIRSTSSVRLTLHLQLSFEIGSPSLLLVDWSDIAAVLVLPLFRHPIRLHVSQLTTRKRLGSLLVDLVPSFERHSEMKKLLEEGKLASGKGESGIFKV